MGDFEVAINTSEGIFWRAIRNGAVWLGVSVGNKKLKLADSIADLPPEICGWHDLTVAALKQALSGVRPEFAASGSLRGTDFSGRMESDAANCIRRTRSYGELAELLAIRKPFAPSRACGANPIPVIVPCHRVLAANRKLGDFPPACIGN